MRECHKEWTECINTIKKRQKDEAFVLSFTKLNTNASSHFVENFLKIAKTS